MPNPIDPRAIELYDEYTHAPLPRRVFLERLAAIAGGATAAAALLPLLENDYAHAAVVTEDDARLTVERTTFPGSSGPVRGYLAKPKKQEKGGARRAAVLVIHENRGLNAHIEDVARRVAVAGFTGFAADLLSASGGTPPEEDKAREMIGALDPEVALADARAAVAWLHGPSGSEKTGGVKVGAIGFCWGGGMVNRLAVAEPALDAGVVFYGMSPALDGVPSIKAPLLLHYAGRDERINATVPAYEAALEAAGKRFEIHRYEDVEHAFHNDTNAARYNAEAAELAWKRTILFLRKNLT